MPEAAVLRLTEGAAGGPQRGAQPGRHRLLTLLVWGKDHDDIRAGLEQLLAQLRDRALGAGVQPVPHLRRQP